MIAATRFTCLTVLAALAAAWSPTTAGATKALIAPSHATKAAKPAVAHRVHWKRRAHKRRYNKRWAKRKTYKKPHAYKKRYHHKRWRSSDYGITYVRPKPYAYIYRYQPYVYHRPRVYIRPVPRSAHRRRYWPRKVWRRRYDRRPGVYYHHR